MKIVLLALVFVLIILVACLSFKIYYLKKSIVEIECDVKSIINSDTNKLIGISSNDKDIKRLANVLNFQLRILRKQKQQFSQGDYELKQSMTNAAHDIRTPLTTISGYIELLEQEVKTDKEKRYINIMKERISSLKSISEELFIYSIANSEKNNLIKEEINVNNVLEETIADFYPKLTESNITPEIKISKMEIIRMLDRSALVRVFSNLMSNAIKYNNGNIKISLLDSGEIIFSNNTTGLDHVQVAQLFNRFYTVKLEKRSTGVGLAISKELVEEMGGEIKANYDRNKLSIHVVFTST